MYLSVGPAGDDGNRRSRLRSRGSKGGVGQDAFDEDTFDEDTLFLFCPVIKDTDTVPSDAYTRIQHRQSKHWLHATTATVTRNTNENDVFGLVADEDSESTHKSINNAAKQGWDGAQLHEVIFTKQQHFQVSQTRF